MRIAASSASFRDNLRQPSSSWNRMLDNVPVCVAAKSIEDGRYIFANRAVRAVLRAFPAHHILGKRADEIFQTETAARIVEADRSGAQFIRWPGSEMKSWSSAVRRSAS